ncbi:hypothetical protein [Streptomyces violens]|uniref:hypothetical protein n=1 Tax=Streptomyces violens TaxID=66377 RepID=UPI0004C0AF8B|nr:hypothetical protein [Streptomyces violens]
MLGFGRRTATACPWIAARDSLDTRVRVVEPDLTSPGEPRSPVGSDAGDMDERVLAWVRLHGHPLALVHATGTPGDRAGLRRAPAAAAPLEPAVPTGHRTRGGSGPGAAARP